MILEDIGEGDDALLCITSLIACCKAPYTGVMGPSLGNWYFPNGTRVPSVIRTSGEGWDIYRTGDQMVVRMNRRRGGVDGIYRCDSLNVTQTIYIGVYSASTGEWFMFTPVLCSTAASSCRRVKCDRQHFGVEFIWSQMSHCYELSCSYP